MTIKDDQRDLLKLARELISDDGGYCEMTRLMESVALFVVPETKMQYGDLGMRIEGGKLSARGLFKMRDDADVPEGDDDDWEYDVGWAEGIPHCACCSRFCLYPSEGDVVAVPSYEGGERYLMTKDRLSVVSVPGIPISEAMCPDCLVADAWPYGLLVAQAACIIDVTREDSWTSQLADYFIGMIDRSLRYHGKTWRTFLADVRDDVQAMEEYMRDHTTDGPEREEPSRGCPVCDRRDLPPTIACKTEGCPYHS